MALPNPDMNFTPFDPLTAAELNQMVANIEALQDWSAFEAGSFDIDLLPDGGITSDKIVQNFFKGRYQSHDNNSIASSDQSGLTVQFGWVQNQGTGNDNITGSVTFPTALSSILWAGATSIGAKSGAMANISDSGSYTNISFVNLYNISTTGFTFRMERRDATIFGNTSYYAFSWIAIGIV